MGGFYGIVCMMVILLVGLLPAMVMAWRYVDDSSVGFKDTAVFFKQLVPAVWVFCSLASVQFQGDLYFAFFTANLPGAIIPILGILDPSILVIMPVVSSGIIWLLCSAVHAMGATRKQFVRPVRWLFVVTFLVIASPLLRLASNGHITPEGLRIPYLLAACNLSIFFHLIGLVIVLALERALQRRSM